MNLSVKGRIDMGEVIVITSGKGGVGKTTTTANIGIGLSQLQKKVVVIDTDLGLRNLDVVMGLEIRNCICCRRHRQRIRPQFLRNR